MSRQLPPLAQALETLRGMDEFQSVLAFMEDERKRLFMDLRQAENPHDVMKLAGSIATIQELGEILS